MMLNFRTLFLVSLLLVLFLVVGTLDFKEEKIEYEYNCKMVELGYYPKHFCK